MTTTTSPATSCRRHSILAKDFAPIEMFVAPGSFKFVVLAMDLSDFANKIVLEETVLK